MAVPAWAAAAALTDSRIERELERIFTDPAYERGFHEIAPPGWLISSLLWLRNVVAEWVESLLRGLAELNAESPLLFWLILASSVVVLVLLLVHIAWTVSRVLRAGHPAQEAKPAEAPARERAKRLLAESAALASEGKYGEALRLLFLALLGAIQERESALAPDGWTNHEIVGGLRVPDDLRMQLGNVADAFDLGWYGRRQVPSDRYESCRQTISDFLRDMPIGGASAARAEPAARAPERAGPSPPHGGEKT